MSLIKIFKLIKTWGFRIFAFSNFHFWFSQHLTEKAKKKSSQAKLINLFVDTTLQQNYNVTKRCGHWTSQILRKMSVLRRHISLLSQSDLMLYRLRFGVNHRCLCQMTALVYLDYDVWPTSEYSHRNKTLLAVKCWHCTRNSGCSFLLQIWSIYKPNCVFVLISEVWDFIAQRRSTAQPFSTFLYTTKSVQLKMLPYVTMQGDITTNWELDDGTTPGGLPLYKDTISAFCHVMISQLNVLCEKFYQHTRILLHKI